MDMRIRNTLLSMTVAALVVTAVLPSAAWASKKKVARARNEVMAIKASLDELDNKLEIAIEDYNEARLKLSNTNEKISVNRRKLKRATRQLKRSQTLLNDRARGIYKNDGKLGYMELIFTTRDFAQFIEQMDMMSAIGAQDSRTVDYVRRIKLEVEERRRRLIAERRERKAIKRRMESQKERIESRISYRKKLYNSAKAQLSEMEQQEAAEQSRLRREAMARLSREHYSSDGGGFSDAGRISSSAPSHGGAVGIAMQYLGVPYVWGGSSPSGFDCSGFVMYVYSQMGIGLPHSSRAQYSSGGYVSRSSLQPGDLVFFGSPIHHVGLYIGGDQFIHAPHSGDVVKISSLSGRGNYAGACRP